MKRTIEIVLNKENGSTVYADSFFLKKEHEVFKFRNELQKAIKGVREPLFVCYFCGQKIKINGGGKTKKILHFAHKKDSDDCDIKTDNKYSKQEIERVKYNGAKESPLHFETKETLKELIELNKDFSDIKVEKVVKSNTNYLEWKRPDISAKYKSLNIVFEIQLSTTFLSVIVDRECFYMDNKTFILWIFRDFVIDEFKQRFTEKDVFYSNNRNAFVLDSEAIRLSQENNDLFLLCYYQIPTIKNLKIEYNWESKYISFNQLTFDDINFKVFYFNVDKEEEILKEHILVVEKEIEEKEIKEPQKAETLKQQIEKNIDYNYYDYSSWNYEDEVENKPVVEQKNQYLIDNNRLFEETNRISRIGLRNEFYITNYQRIFLQNHNELVDKFFELFKNGYVFTKTDFRFINKEFENKLESNESLNQFTFIYFISISIFFSKLIKHKELYELYNNSTQQLLFSILSIKKKRVIGSNFSNLIQVVNHYTNIRNDRVFFFDVIVKAIEVYYGIDEFCRKEDRKGLLKAKILNSNNWKPQQETKYNKLVSIVFPELNLDQM